MNPVLFYIIYTSITMALLFGGYNIISEYLTIVYGSTGFYAYVVIYVCNIIGSLCAPFLAFHLIGVKWSIFVGAFTYFVWIAIFNLNSVVLLMVMSVANGIGSGIMRSQQNVWISSIVDKETAGRYIGIFNTIFSFNGIFASVVFVVALFLDYSLDFLVYFFIVVSLVSLTMLLFIKSVELTPEHMIDLELLVSLTREPKFLWTCPLIIFQSVGIIFTYAVLPKYMEDNNLAVAITFFVYSIVYAIGSYLAGLLCDKINTVWLVSAVCINTFLMAGYICFFKFLEHRNYRAIIGYTGVGFFTGIADSTVNSVLIYVFSVNYNNKTVFSLHRAVYSLFCAVYAGIAVFFPWYANLLIYSTSSLFGLVCFRKSIQIYLENKEKTEELIETEPPIIQLDN